MIPFCYICTNIFFCLLEDLRGSDCFQIGLSYPKGGSVLPVCSFFFFLISLSISQFVTLFLVMRCQRENSVLDVVVLGATQTKMCSSRALIDLCPCSEDCASHTVKNVVTFHCKFLFSLCLKMLPASLIGDFASALLEHNGWEHLQFLRAKLQRPSSAELSGFTGREAGKGNPQ